MTVENDITAHIDSAIDGMATANSYNFNYANVNEYDPSSRTYPSVMTSYMSADGQEIEVANKYTSEIECIFLVTVDDSEDVDIGLDKVTEDFKRLFDDEHTNLQNLGMILSRFIRKDKSYKLNKSRPGIIDIRWMVRYRVDMDDPSST